MEKSLAIKILKETVQNRELFVVKHKRNANGGYTFSVLVADQNGKIQDVGNYFATAIDKKPIDPTGNNTHDLWMIKANPGINLTIFVNEQYKEL